MKTADFKSLKPGDLVEVPRTQFSEQRRGWNGWLFSEAVVIEKGGRKQKQETRRKSSNANAGEAGRIRGE